MTNEELIEYFKSKGIMDYSISLFSITGKIKNKEEIASTILETGIKEQDDKRIRDLINPKGLISDCEDIDEIIKYKAEYTDRDICNILIIVPQQISIDDQDYYIGYPKHNLSGYTTAKHQKDYNCFLTDFFEQKGRIPRELLLGYYYKDEDGNEVLIENKYYDNTKETLSIIFKDMDKKINTGINNRLLLDYASQAIKEKRIYNNSTYQTITEYFEYNSLVKDNKRLNKKDFVELLETFYQDYALYIHGVDNPPKFSKTIVNAVLRGCLHLDEFYGFSGTCEPRGPVNEIEDFDKALDYHYGDNNECSYNIIILTPKTIKNINNQEFFLGYSKNNTSGTFPKSMKDFDSLLTDIVNEKGCVPKEFVLAYQRYGPEIEEEFVINKRHISLQNEELQRIFGTSFLRVNDELTEKFIPYFEIGNVDEDRVDKMAGPIANNGILSAVQNTSIEYFDYKDSKKQLKKIK